MDGVQISPQVEQEIDATMRALGPGPASIEYLLSLQRMLTGSTVKRAHMADYLGAMRGAGAGAGAGSGAAQGRRGGARRGGKRGESRLEESPTPLVALCGRAGEAGQDEFVCADCGAECCMDNATSDMVCTGCGVCTFVYGHSADNVTYSEHQHMNRSPGAAYLRMNHFNELLAQIQGRETKHIPEEVLAAVRAELRKRRMLDLECVTFAQIDGILHDLGATAFYDHFVSITGLVTGRDVSAIPPDMEAHLQAMFTQIQRPYDKYKPDARKNFMCYRFCLFQLLTLIPGGTEFLPRCRLLKSRQRLADLDEMWQAICRELGWPYLPVA